MMQIPSYRVAGCVALALLAFTLHGCGKVKPDADTTITECEAAVAKRVAADKDANKEIANMTCGAITNETLSTKCEEEFTAGTVFNTTALLGDCVAAESVEVFETSIQTQCKVAVDEFIAGMIAAMPGMIDGMLDKMIEQMPPDQVTAITSSPPLNMANATADERTAALVGMMKPQIMAQMNASIEEGMANATRDGIEKCASVGPEQFKVYMAKQEALGNPLMAGPDASRLFFMPGSSKHWGTGFPTRSSARQETTFASPSMVVGGVAGCVLLAVAAGGYAVHSKWQRAERTNRDGDELLEQNDEDIEVPE